MEITKPAARRSLTLGIIASSNPVTPHHLLLSYAFYSPSRNGINLPELSLTCDEDQIQIGLVHGSVDEEELICASGTGILSLRALPPVLRFPGSDQHFLVAQMTHEASEVQPQTLCNDHSATTRSSPSEKIG